MRLPSSTAGRRRQEALRVTIEHLATNKPGYVMQIHPKGFDYALEDAAIAKYRLGENPGRMISR
jgi:hypothetical protein